MHSLRWTHHEPDSPALDSEKPDLGESRSAGAGVGAITATAGDGDCEAEGAGAAAGTLDGPDDRGVALAVDGVPAPMYPDPLPLDPRTIVPPPIRSRTDDSTYSARGMGEEEVGMGDGHTPATTAAAGQPPLR